MTYPWDSFCVSVPEMRLRPTPNVTPASRTESRETREPSEDLIRERAYQIYLRRGGEPGRDGEDWEQARRELASEPLTVGRQNSR